MAHEPVMALRLSPANGLLCLSAYCIGPTLEWPVQRLNWACILSIEFELLAESHATQLLEFEATNRSWFEQWIAPREPGFYSMEGVFSHIQSLQFMMRDGTGLSFVATKEGRIIARANLKNVCTRLRTAEIGYRVAMLSTGAGFGTACVAKLVTEATGTLQLVYLRAHVLDNNSASRRILEKHLFLPMRYEPNHFEIKGVPFGCTIFERRL